MSEASTMSYPSYGINPQAQAVTMFNMSTLLNQKDSRWLQLEVCRENQRQKCTRSDADCKFAHPPTNVEVQNGRVTACYDSIKGRCNREKPACKYFHPPQHLKDQLLINGRNHLALKNALAQQMQQQIIPGQVPAMFGAPYIGASVPQLAYTPGYLAGGLMSPLLGSDQGLLGHQAHHPAQQQQPQQLQQQQQQQSKQRNDRIEMGHTFPQLHQGVPQLLHPQQHSPAPHQLPGMTALAAADPGQQLHHQQQLAIASLAAAAGGVSGGVAATKKRQRESSEEMLLALPAGTVLPYKRAASEKSGLPVYQPGVQQQHQQQLQQQQQQAASAYHQILQMQQQPSIVPASYGNTAQAISIPRYQ